MGLDYRVKCCPDGLVTDRRRRIKVLDCTIRDGGICNDWHFDHAQVLKDFKAFKRSILGATDGAGYSSFSCSESSSEGQSELSADLQRLEMQLQAEPKKDVQENPEMAHFFSKESPCGEVDLDRLAKVTETLPGVLAQKSD